jgi:energy-converting hydrogenase Eha subunit F
MGDWSRAYPDAKLYASPRLASKRKDLTFYKTLSTDTPEPEWSGQIDQCIFGSGNGWFDEIVFFHRASRTVVFTDMIMDFNEAIFSSISRVTTQWNQMYRHTPRGAQLAHIFDRASLRDSLKTVRAWEPEYAIVAHSPWLCVEGKKQVVDLLDSAFDWLTPQPVIVEAVMTIVRLLTLLLVILPIHALIVLTADLVYPRLVKRGGSK